MPDSLITTKLFIPPLRAELVPRKHLVDKLNDGLGSKLILISAPAGYGKTTLLGEWIDQQEVPFGWVSLDANDNSPERFFSYMVAGLQSAGIPIDERILSAFQDQRDHSHAPYLQPVINQISELDQEVFLVLDDYHRINNPEIHQSLTYFLDNLPVNLHLVIATRSDPPLRLAKLRAQGQLCEIRVNELRFSIAEGVHYFNQSMGLGLTAEEISTLMEKTEGWVVGLQLAGLSLEKHPDRHYFITTFAGNDRYVADYLLDEALNRQPKKIQEFLLQTSILDRLCAPLCDAVTSIKDSQVILGDLESANLFLIPLDNQRIWYRYHHLFAELLQNRLGRAQADSVVGLHRQASDWYQKNHLLADAINHALVADDVERIVQLTEEMAVYKMNLGELTAVIAWLERQSDSLLIQHPWLLVTRAWVFFNTGKYDDVETSLSELEDILRSGSYSEGLVHRIEGHIAAVRSYMAEVREGADTAILLAEEALRLLPDKDLQLRAFVSIRWANCLAWIGDFPRAIQALEEGGIASKRAGDGQLAISALSEKAALQWLIGDLNQAFKSILDVKDYAERLAQKDGRRLPAMSQLYRQYASILLERNQLAEALHYAQESLQIAQQWGERESLFSVLMILAKINLAAGNDREFERYFEHSQQIAAQVSPQVLEHYRMLDLHFQLQRGRIEEAERTFSERQPAPPDGFEQSQRIEFQNYCHYLLLAGKYAESLEAVNHLLDVVTQAGSNYYIIRYRVMQAIILHHLRREEEAARSLDAALTLACPQGYLRPFLDHGEIVARLLYQSAKKGTQVEFCQELLDEFAKQQTPVPASVKAGAGELVEPLSERELEVLKQIALGATNQEIAQRLYLSLHTVKSHARNIYSKLGVKNRTEAVAKGRLYGLIPQE